MSIFLKIATALTLICTAAYAQQPAQRAVHRFIALTAAHDRSHVLIQLCSDASGRMQCIPHKRITSDQYDQFRDQLIEKIRNRQLGEDYVKVGSYALAGVAGAGTGVLAYSGAFFATVLSITSGPVGFVGTAAISFTKATVITGAATYGAYKGSKYILERTLNEYDLPPEVSQALYELRWSRRIFTIQTASFQNNAVLSLLPR